MSGNARNFSWLQNKDRKYKIKVVNPDGKFVQVLRNFNPNMCGAAKITVAEVEELVPAGSLDPNQIHIPGIFVQRIVQGNNYEKRIEKLTLNK